MINRYSRNITIVFVLSTFPYKTCYKIRFAKDFIAYFFKR